MESAKQKSGNNSLWILILIILLILAGAAYFGYKIIFPADDSATTQDDEDTQSEDQDDTDSEEEDSEADEDTTDEDEDVAEECVQNTAPAGWVALDNTYAGYTAYRPGWYYRIFSGGAMLGMAPSPIPVDSEYAGDLVIRMHTGAQATVEAEFSDRLEAGYTDTTVVAGCREWTVFEGIEPANEISDEKQAKFAIVTVDGDVYSLQTSMAASQYASTEAKFDILIDIMVFN